MGGNYVLQYYRNPVTSSPLLTIPHSLKKGCWVQKFFQPNKTPKYKIQIGVKSYLQVSNTIPNLNSTLKINF